MRVLALGRGRLALAPSVADHVTARVRGVLRPRLGVRLARAPLPPPPHAGQRAQRQQHQRRDRGAHRHDPREPPRRHRLLVHRVPHAPQVPPRALRLQLRQRDGARPPAPAVQARAVVPVHAVPARPAVAARERGALVHVDAAVLAGEARPAAALVVVVHDEALAPVRARLRQAEVDAGLAARAQEPGRALAALAVHEVDAGAAVLAGDSGAVVDVDLAAVAAEAAPAGAPEAVAGPRAVRSVPAGLGGAGVRLDRAVGASEAHGAHAHVAGAALLAEPAVLAGPVGAGEAARLAARALVPLRTGAGHVPALVGHASAAVQAGPHRARVQRLLAVGAGVVRGTDARVAALAGVVARALVLARLVVRAVVEVLVAEQAAPALRADAVPGARARPVHAARMPLALVAQLAHPAGVAAGIKKLRKSRDNERLIRRGEQWRRHCWGISAQVRSGYSHALVGLEAVAVLRVAAGQAARCNKKKTFVSARHKRIVNGRRARINHR